jgi:hypothetical protein
MKNLIYRSAMEVEPDRAASVLAKALDIECGPQLANRREWMHAGHAARCLLLADWLRNVAYEAGVEGERPVPMYIVGGEAYRNQND